MNIVIIAVGLFLFGASVYAQNEMAQPTAENRGFAALLVSPTHLSGGTGVLLGGGICGIFERHARMGLFGATLVNSVYGQGERAASRRSLNFGYGGLYGEYVVDPEHPLHVSAYALMGVGGLAYSGIAGRDQTGAAKAGVNVVLDIDRATDAFFIAEPGASAEIGLTENVRMSAGVGYRYVYGLATEGVSDATISGAIGTIMLRVGVF